MPEKERAGRNRTIVLADDEKIELAKKLVNLSGSASVKPEEIMDKTILGDLNDILDKIPAGIADLIILDPPYNLRKDFHGYKFKSVSSDEYYQYLQSWFPKVVSILKPNGSLYLCGDWRCSAVLQTVMEENLCVLNRITWQREKGRGAYSNWKNGMEDVWFGVKNPKDYYFNVDAVKLRRKVIAPLQS